MTHIFLSAGEASGDIHGANLIRAVRSLDPSLTCEGLGGCRMADAGMTLCYDLAGHAIMGFTEVVKSLGLIRRLFHDAVARLRDRRPDCLVLIDYPGFNIRLAKAAHKQGIPVVYYISPQVWAWKRGRIHTIARLVKKMLVILPFEEKIYKDIGVDCAYVGHPLLDHVAATRISGAYRDGAGILVGLLPGSREQEIARLLPVLLAVARGIRDRYPTARFVVPCVDAVREAQVRAIVSTADVPVETAIGGMYDVLDAARFCLVASGTATLETALFGVPFVLLYKVSAVSYWLARHLVKVDYIGLANILAARGIVPEFIQNEAIAEKVLPVALDLIADTDARRRMLGDFAELRQILGVAGASMRAAEHVLKVAVG